MTVAIQSARIVSAEAARLLDAHCFTGTAEVDDAISAALERAAEHLLAWADHLCGLPRPVSVPPGQTTSADVETDPASLRHSVMVLARVCASVEHVAAGVTGQLQADGMRIARALEELAAGIERQSQLIASARAVAVTVADELEARRAIRARERGESALRRTAMATLAV